MKKKKLSAEILNKSISDDYGAFVRLLIIFIYLISSSAVSWAYLSNIDSGELVPKDQYRLIIEPQLGHFNLTAHFDAGISDDSQLRVSLGAGENGTNFDFYYKTVPYPDFENQPAIGYKVGTSFASDKGQNILNIRFIPIVSKIIHGNDIKWVPYASLPMGIALHKSNSSTPLHLSVGTEITLNSTPDMQMGFEVGSSLKDSFSYGSVFVSFYFEPSDLELDSD